MPKWLSPSTWGRGPHAAPESTAPSLAQLHEQALTRSLGQGLIHGNRIELLLDGPQTYASMFEAIDAARDSIHVESYMVDADGPGAEFARRLIERRREGVRVHLLFDGVGSMRTPRSFFERLESEGVALCEFRPLRRLMSCIDAAAHRRNHRKLMVIDGRVGFIGGLNISREYASGSAPNLLRSKDGGAGGGWRDSHLRVEGPVVAEMQALFVAHWNCHAPVRVTMPPGGAALEPRGTQPAAVAATRSGRGRNPFYRALLAAVQSARSRAYITTAYFVPPRRLLRALVAAAERGVDVQLLLPGHSDFWAPLHAGRWHYGRLLRGGVRVHEWHDTLLHAKSAVIDGLWAAVGSSNLDWRSTVHNAEANLVILDGPFAAELERVFHADVARSQTVQLQRWLRRGRLDRLKEWAALRFESLL